MKADPVEFRKTMGDMKFDGDEPLWSRLDFAESAGVGRKIDENNPQSLLAEIERLRMDKRDLAAELEKTQTMLTLQYDIEKTSRKYMIDENSVMKD